MSSDLHICTCGDCEPEEFTDHCKFEIALRRAERGLASVQGRIRQIEDIAADLTNMEPEAVARRILKAEQDREAYRGRALARFKTVRLKADPQTDGTLLEETILMLDVPEQGDAIEVALGEGGRGWLDVERRVFTPEGEVEVWVTMEGYDRDSLEEAVRLAKEQFDGSAP